jgi:quercetin dioxygenase-like cupin family protein
MHRTDPVDYAIILTGEIYMLLGNEDVHLKAGDVVVQRGTNHTWSNCGSETCIIAFVLIGAVTSRTAEAGQNGGIPGKKTFR